MKRHKMCPRLRALLDASGAPYEMQSGRDHARLLVGGTLVGVLPRTTRREIGHAADNMIAAVRRRLKEMESTR